MRRPRNILAIGVVTSLALTGCSLTKETTTSTAGQPGGSATAGSGSGTGQAAATGNLKDLPTGTDALCGTKPIRIAHVDGYGANSWRKINREELKAELSVCKNVTIAYTDSSGDVTKFNSAINSYVAQGFDALVVFDDFGEQGLAAMRNAMKAGMAVVPYVGEPGGTPGTDYTAFMAEDKPKVGQDQAEWLAKVLPNKGNLIFLGGTPGNSSSPAFMTPLKAAAEPLGFKFLSPTPIDTNWDPGQEQRVMSGLISKYPKIDGIVSDYGVASVGGIRAWINANKPHPPLAVNASDNDLVCQYEKLKDKWPDFELFSLDGSTRVIRWAGRRAIATVNKIELNDPSVYQLYPYIDTANGLVPKCDPSFPPDADLSSALSPDQLAQLFK